MANEFLKKTGYSLERALDRYFNSNASAASTKTRQSLDKFFREICRPGESTIEGDSLMALIENCGSDPSDLVWLAIAYHCKAKKAACFTLDEWIHGMRALNLTSLAGLKKALTEIRTRSFAGGEETRNIYRFAFTYSLDEGVRNLRLEDALMLWDLLLKPLNWPLYEAWVKFVTGKVSVTVVTRDTWNLIYELATTVKADLSDFDASGAWPVMIDEFVEVQSRSSLCFCVANKTIAVSVCQ